MPETVIIPGITLVPAPGRVAVENAGTYGVLRRLGSALGGFDLVYEFREDALAGFLTRTLPAIDVEVPFKLPGLTEETNEGLEKRIRASYQILELLRPVLPGLSAWHWPDCCSEVARKRCFVVSLGPPRFKLLPETGCRAELCWDVLLTLKEAVVTPSQSGAEWLRQAVATVNDVSGPFGMTPQAGRAVQVPPKQTECPNGPALVSLHGCLKMVGVTDFEDDRSKYRFRLLLDVRDSALTLETSDELFSGIYSEAAQAYFEQAFSAIRGASPIPLTNWISPAGAMRPGERLENLNEWRLDLALLNGIGNQGNAIACGLALTREGLLGRRNLLLNFLVGRPFGYLIREPILRSLIQLIWKRADTPKVLETRIPVDMARDSTRVTGSADVRFTFDTLADVRLVTPDSSSKDAIRLSGTSTIQALRIYDENGDRIKNIGDLGKPETKPWAISLFPFSHDPTPGDGAGKEFVQNIGKSLLTPIFKPFVQPTADWDIQGRVSRANRLLFLLGEVDWEV